MWWKMSAFKDSSVHFISLGHRPYAEVLTEQFRLREERRAGNISDTVLIVEHPKVITEGRRDASADFLVPPDKLKQIGVAVEKVNRGGRLTYHGPGQLVAYFLLNIKERSWNIPKLVWTVEECGIQTLKQLGLEVERRSGCPGLWVQNRKIASLGLSVDRGLTMHGLALNIAPELSDYDWIIPCGEKGGHMTSLFLETGNIPPWPQAEEVFRRQASEVLTIPIS